jgi:hypothetical protein
MSPAMTTAITTHSSILRFGAARVTRAGASIVGVPHL